MRNREKGSKRKRARERQRDIDRDRDRERDRERECVSWYLRGVARLIEERILGTRDRVVR